MSTPASIFGSVVGSVFASLLCVASASAQVDAGPPADAFVDDTGSTVAEVPDSVVVLPTPLVAPETREARPLVPPFAPTTPSFLAPPIIDLDAPPQDTVVVVEPRAEIPPVPEALGPLDDALDESLRDLIPGMPSERRSPWAPFWIFVLVVALSVVTRITRDRLPEEGAIPRALTYTHVLLCMLAVLFGVLFIARVLPPNLAPALTWMLIAAAVAIGFSSWYLVRDLLAWLVITVERRILVGTWIAGEGFAGTVERVGPRATWIRDGRGHRVGVPNHQVLREPVLSGRKGTRELEVRLRMDERVEGLRPLLRDAVLASPWVFPGDVPEVFQDPDDPIFWNVRAQLLDVAFGPRFEGELHERVLEMIRAAKHRPVAAHESEE